MNTEKKFVASSSLLVDHCLQRLPFRAPNLEEECSARRPYLCYLIVDRKGRGHGTALREISVSSPCDGPPGADSRTPCPASSWHKSGFTSFGRLTRAPSLTISGFATATWLPKPSHMCLDLLRCDGRELTE